MSKQEITTVSDQQHAPEMPAAGVIAVPAEASSVKPLPFSNEVKDLILDALLEQGPQGWTWRAGRQGRSLSGFSRRRSGKFPRSYATKD